jgi:hypothetical protein
MKKFLPLIAFVMIALTAASQRFHGGVMAGGVASQVQGDTYGGFYKLGVYCGGFVGFDVGKFSTLQMELDFIQKGSRKNTNPDKGDEEFYLLRLNYIEVPLIWQVHFLKRITFEMGPAMDVLISSYEETQDGEIENVVPLRPVNLNALAGLSCDIIPSLKVNLRFIMSITTIRHGSTTGYYTRFGTWGQYNDLLALTVWYRIK